MRNVLLFTSVLFIAVGCERKETERGQMTGQSSDDMRGQTGDQPSGVTGSTVPGQGAGGTGGTGTGTTDTSGTTGMTNNTGNTANTGGGGTADTQGTTAQDTTAGGAGTVGGAGTTAGAGGGGTTGGGTAGSAAPGTGGAGGYAGTTGGAGQGGTMPPDQSGSMPSGQGGTMGGASGQMASISCDQIVTSSTRQKHLKNATVTDMSSAQGGASGGMGAGASGGAGATGGASGGAAGGTAGSMPSSGGMAGSKITMCQVQGANLREPVSIQAVCGAATGGQMAQSTSELRRSMPGSQEVKNVGKAAVIVKSGQTQTLTAIDDDSNCRLDVSAPQNIDAVALSRELLDNIKSDQG